MEYQNRDNVYWKMGMVRPDPSTASQESAVVAKFEVGPGGAQINLEELKSMAKGQAVVKRHNDGQMEHSRIDVEVRIGDGPGMFTKDEAMEIYKIEKAKADEVAAVQAAKQPVDASTFDELQDMVRKQQRDIAKLTKALAEDSKEEAKVASE